MTPTFTSLAATKKQAWYEPPRGGSYREDKERDPMKKYALLPIIATIVLLLVCQPAAFSGQNRNFIAVLSGDQENPPNDSQGRGVAIFHLSKDGSELEYKLIVANI